MADCNPHSTLGSRICHGLPHPISALHLFAHPFPRHVHQCLAPIKSSLTSRSLGLPRPISVHHLVCSPFPQTCSPLLGSYQVLAHLKIAWFASSHLLPPPHLLTLPHRVLLHGWLAGGRFMDGLVLIECESPVTSHIMLSCSPGMQ